MKNKIKLKKHLICISLISLCLVVIFLLINVYEYRTYTQNFNNKLSSIVQKIEEEYPEISESEIMEILNSNEEASDIFEKYSIDLSKDSLVITNENYFHIFLCLNIGFLICVIVIITIIFLIYNKNKDKEIDEITNYINEINMKNYNLNIDEISEDELSILKNEIYKVTIMLKEQAENSTKDKLELKDSLSDISHQLKTPLTSILIILDDLIDDPYMDKETREDFIRDIKREITNINFLAQSILKLSKFDANAIDFIDKEVIASDLIENAVKNVDTLCDLKNIKIEVNSNKEDTLICDFNWQVEAITNIIKNCIEHSSKNSKIEIKEEKNKVYTLIEIKDNGSGIDKEDLPHIFERFYKGKNSSKESTGIGLSLSKTIIEKNKGTIEVESNIGEGTKFKVKYFEI